MDALVERLRRRIPDAKDDELLRELLRQSAEMICAYTSRTALPDVLAGAQIELAAMLFNRMGMEGESAHTEGSVSRSAESLPEILRRQLNPHRLAKGVGA